MQFHIFRDAKLEWRWQLSNDEGRKVADSGEGYREKDECLEAIALVQASDNAVVVENVTTLMEAEMLQMPGLFNRH